ncbi:MAG: hypothetical protein PV340_01080 [Wolbachia sp.]|nr:hypothetical protein [Wolbachia sp.]MDD9336603.1 hypothetical protein [Wolbachia sp.]
MKFIKKCSNLWNRVATSVKLAMFWCRGEYNAKSSDDEVSQIRNDIKEVKLLSYIILDCVYRASSWKTNKTGDNKSTEPCNSGKNTKWSERHQQIGSA